MATAASQPASGVAPARAVQEEPAVEGRFTRCFENAALGDITKLALKLISYLAVMVGSAYLGATFPIIELQMELTQIVFTYGFVLEMFGLACRDF